MLTYRAFAYLLAHSHLLKRYWYPGLTSQSPLADFGPAIESMARLWPTASGGERGIITAALWLIGPDAKYVGWTHEWPEFTPDTMQSLDQQNGTVLLAAFAVAMGEGALADQINPLGEEDLGQP